MQCGSHARSDQVGPGSFAVLLPRSGCGLPHFRTPRASVPGAGVGPKPSAGAPRWAPGRPVPPQPPTVVDDSERDWPCARAGPTARHRGAGASSRSGHDLALGLPKQVTRATVDRGRGSRSSPIRATHSRYRGNVCGKRVPGHHRVAPKSQAACGRMPTEAGVPLSRLPPTRTSAWRGPPGGLAAEAAKPRRACRRTPAAFGSPRPMVLASVVRSGSPPAASRGRWRGE